MNDAADISDAAPADPLKIVISLPYLFSYRDFLFTPVWEEMARRTDVRFFIVRKNREIAQIVEERGCANIASIGLRPGRVAEKGLGRVFRAAPRIGRGVAAFDKEYAIPSLIYRFTAINGLSNRAIRAAKSPEEQHMQTGFYDYRKGEAVGRPFALSRAVFSLLYRAHHAAGAVARRPQGVEFENDLKPDVFVLGRVHFSDAAMWTRAMRRMGVPVMGIVSSWDHPTTKGPTVRGINHFVVSSRRMVEEMTGLHGIPEARITQVGKVQMDPYRDSAGLMSRTELFRELGLPEDCRLVTLGTNNKGLKEHEVSIAAHLARSVREDRYGRVGLLIRTHPQDVEWERDFAHLAFPGKVVCLRACGFGAGEGVSMDAGLRDQRLLASLMKHSSVVIQSRGSLALDAIAFDTPVIALAFDGDLKRLPNDSFVHEYAYEHYKPIVRARGTWMVGSYAALDRAVLGYLKDSSIHAEGRVLTRREQVEPLDGKASFRTVDCMVRCARLAREGALPRPDWSYSGMGDTAWASRQACSVEDFVER